VLLGRYENGRVLSVLLLPVHDESIHNSEYDLDEVFLPSTVTSFPQSHKQFQNARYRLEPANDVIRSRANLNPAISATKIIHGQSGPERSLSTLFAMATTFRFPLFPSLTY